MPSAISARSSSYKAGKGSAASASNSNNGMKIKREEEDEAEAEAEAAAAAASAAAAGGEDREEREREREEAAAAVIPFLDIRAVSPGPTPDLSRSTSHDGGGEGGSQSSLRGGNNGNNNSRATAACGGNTDNTAARGGSRKDRAAAYHSSELRGGKINDRSASNDGNDVLLGVAGKYHQSGSNNDEESDDDSSSSSSSSDDENNIVLSLRDGTYKRIINDYWEKLWGGIIEGNGPMAKELASIILDELKADLSKSGGILFRKSTTGRGFSEATDQVALDKIRNDLLRGKQDYKRSIRYRSRKKPPPEEEEPTASDIEVEDNDCDAMPTGDYTKKHAPFVRENDLVVSLRNDRYQNIINKCVETFIHGQSNRRITSVASDHVKKVRNAGGKFFKLVKKKSYFEVDDEAAQRSEFIHGSTGSHFQLLLVKRRASLFGHTSHPPTPSTFEEIITDVKDRLADARRTDDKCVIVNMKGKNDKYKIAIMKGARMKGAKSLAMDYTDKSSASARADEISKKLMDNFKSSGAKHFFKNAVDEDAIPWNEALEKITKDVCAQARYGTVGSEPLVIDQGSNKGTFISSTRKRQKRGNSTIHDTPREYMAGYIERNVLPRLGWIVRKDALNNPVAYKEGCGEKNAVEGIDKFVGYSDILDEAYLSGLYEEHVVRSEEGREFLEHAGILDDPESIFYEDLKRRKRQKRGRDQTNLTQDASRTRMSRDVLCENMNGSKSHADTGKRPKPETHTPDQSAPESKANNVAYMPHDPADANPNPNDVTTGQSAVEAATHVSTSMACGNNNGSETISPTRNVSVNVMAASKPSTGRLGRVAQVLQTYNDIKTKLLSAKTRVGDTQLRGDTGNCSNENGNKIGALQIEFYSHLKSWLARRVETILESNLKSLKNWVGEFESAVMELERAGDDEDDALCYTSVCDVIIKECREAFPL